MHAAAASRRAPRASDRCTAPPARAQQQEGSPIRSVRRLRRLKQQLAKAPELARTEVADRLDVVLRVADVGHVAGALKHVNASVWQRFGHQVGDGA